MNEKNKVFFEDNFGSFDNYWAESGEGAWVEDNFLYQRADPKDLETRRHSTIWCETKLPADVEISVTAEVIESQLGANNINFFLSYSDPPGGTMYETRAGRDDGAYSHYHELDGYIFTFLRDFRNLAPVNEDGSAKARYRMRRCPGFALVDERFGEQCEAGVPYRLSFFKKGGSLRFAVDGETRLEYEDASPHGGGYFGFRTFQTYLRWSDLRVVELSD